MRIVSGVVLVSIVVCSAFAAWNTYRGGYASMPELSDDQYPISFKSGFRAIVTFEDLLDDRMVLPQVFKRLAFIYPDRRFYGVSFENEPWMKDVWSECEYLTEQEAVEYRAFFAERLPAAMQDKTLEWFCYVDVYGEQHGRGLIFTAPCWLSTKAE